MYIYIYVYIFIYIYIYIELTFNFKDDFYHVKYYSYIRMPIPISMPMPRFPNVRFPGFNQSRMEKKEFAEEMRTMYDFPYFFRHITYFDGISNYIKANLTWHLHIQNLTIKTLKEGYETWLKLKLKNKYTRATLSNGVLLFCCYLN